MRFRAAIKTTLVIAVGVFAGLSLVAGPAAAKKPDADYKLGVGDELFWDEPAIDLAQIPDPSRCDEEFECYEYTVEVKKGEPGTRLRVALHAQLPDQATSFRPFPDLILAPAIENVFRLQLFAPEADPSENKPVEQDITYDEPGSELITGYAIEVFVGGNDAEGKPTPAPVPGVWTIRVVPESVIDMAFRMRAKLEAPAPDPEGLLLPNLRIIPPFELNFPLTAASFGPGARDIPRSRSCMATEATEPAEVALMDGRPPEVADIPTLCLRYSMGVENAGDGVFRLLNISPAWAQDPVEGALWFTGVHEHRMLQWVCTFNAAQCEDATDYSNQPVGKQHQRHLHIHWQGAFDFRLLPFPDGWEEGDPLPELSEFGEGRKMGMAATHENMADWHRFYHQRREPFHDPDDSGCSGGGGNCSESLLQAGWGDAYEWNRDGNYINFPQGDLTGMPRAGFYLLRGATDRLGQIVESNEDDNTSYAFFEVLDDGSVRLIERGYGTDPWDPNKVVSTVAP